MPTWTDEELGEFAFDEYGWSRVFELPAFAVFQYGGLGKPDGATGSPQVELTFEADGEEDTPSHEAVVVARHVVANNQWLLAEGVAALFADFSGGGPDSGMWWHSDLEHVREIIRSANGRPLNEPDDLQHLLGRPSILIQEFGYGYDRPCATICFEAVFEPEHGVGLLTDGKRILGTGYQMDVSPFD